VTTLTAPSSRSPGSVDSTPSAFPSFLLVGTLFGRSVFPYPATGERSHGGGRGAGSVGSATGGHCSGLVAGVARPCAHRRIAMMSSARVRDSGVVCESSVSTSWVASSVPAE
jgi:hypothetical protein